MLGKDVPKNPFFLGKIQESGDGFFGDAVAVASLPGCNRCKLLCIVLFDVHIVGHYEGYTVKLMLAHSSSLVLFFQTASGPKRTKPFKSLPGSLNTSPTSWHAWSRWFSELPPGIWNGFPGRSEILLDYMFVKFVNVFHYGLGKWSKIQVDFLEKHILFSWRCTCFHHLTCCVSETCALNKWMFRLGNSEKK